jgi:hypothetical protein
MPALTLALRRPTYGTGKKVAYTGTAGSVIVPPETNTVILWCTTNAYVRVGATATTTDLPLPAGVIAQIPVDNKTGGPITVSAIQEAAGGDMYCIAAAE